MADRARPSPFMVDRPSQLGPSQVRNGCRLVQIWFPTSLWLRLEEHAHRTRKRHGTGWNRSALVRLALKEYLDAHGGQ